MKKYCEYGVKKYSNKYGRLVLKPITDVMPVRDVRLDNIPQDARFDIETAEKVVLISENRHMQIVVKSVKETVGVVIHESASTCWVAQIESIEYTGQRPQDEIEKEHRMSPCTF